MAHDHQGRATETADGAIMGPGYAILRKMRWGTPPEVIEAIESRVGRIDLDAAAEPHTSVGRDCLTAGDDCLGAPWPLHPGEVGFINPPWSARGVSRAAREAYPGVELEPFPGTDAFATRALQEARVSSATVVALLPHSLDSLWQRHLARRADEVWIARRIAYLDPVTREPATSPPGGTLALVFRGHVPHDGWPGGPRVDLAWDPMGRGA